MGEKYDDCYYDVLPLRREFARFPDPTGPGFPFPDYLQIAQGGPGWRGLFSAHDERRVSDVQQMCADATQRLGSAGTDESSRLAALGDVEERLNGGLHDLQLHGNQSQMTLQMLNREGTIPTTELVDEARASARRVKQAVSDNVGPFETFLADFVSGLRSRALDAAGARVEETVNRVGQLAYTSTAQLYGAVRRGGLIEPEEGTAPTSGAPA